MIGLVSHILAISAIYMILAASLNLIVGYTGLPALSHAAFYCIGAYTSALLSVRFGISPWAGLLAGALLASICGLIIGLPSIRIGGDFLALTTFSFGIVIYTIVRSWDSVTRGPMGIPGIPQLRLFNLSIDSPPKFLLLAVIAVLLTMEVLRRITSSQFGRVLRAIRDDEIAVESIGKNVNRYKLTVFLVGSFFAGISGGLYAHYIGYIDPSSFTPMESILILLMVIFGGMGSLMGSILGATILTAFPEALRFLGMPDSIAAPVRQIIYGLLMVVLIIRRSQGLMGRFKFE